MKVDVLVVTYGEPPEPRFGPQREYSKRILNKLTRLVAPIPAFAVPLLAAWRGYLRMKTWREMNYSSPLESITECQAGGLLAELKQLAPEIDWRVHVAFEFREPSQTEMLNRLRDQGCEHLVTLPMYAAEADFTDGITKRDYNAWRAKNSGATPEAKFVTFRPHQRELADLMAQYVRDEAQKRGYSPEDMKQTGLLLGCHGTVIHPPKGIRDTGYTDTFAIYQLLEERLRDDFRMVRIGWFNHQLGGDWTTPTADDSLKEMRDAGVERFIYYPFGFVADNAETQMEPRGVFEAQDQPYDHLAALNVYPPFLAMLARVVRARLEQNEGTAADSSEAA
ncbi:MAG: hypothetical protein GC154_06660 [bacterium]|nr:hypothetical protein [bacterium]